MFELRYLFMFDLISYLEKLNWFLKLALLHLRWRDPRHILFWSKQSYFDRKGIGGFYADPPEKTPRSPDNCPDRKRNTWRTHELPWQSGFGHKNRYAHLIQDARKPFSRIYQLDQMTKTICFKKVSKKWDERTNRQTRQKYNHALRAWKNKL